MKLFTQVTAYGLVALIACLFLLMGYAFIHHDPHWHIEASAVSSPEHPLAGIWKEEGCEEPWGWAIGPASSATYYVAFCGPGGCSEQGEYRPNTTLTADPLYQVIDSNTLMLKENSAWLTLVRCDNRR